MSYNFLISQKYLRVFLRVYISSICYVFHLFIYLKFIEYYYLVRHWVSDAWCIWMYVECRRIFGVFQYSSICVTFLLLLVGWLLNSLHIQSGSICCYYCWLHWISGQLGENTLTDWMLFKQFHYHLCSSRRNFLRAIF